MNPSASGWVSMFFSLFSPSSFAEQYEDELDFYRKLRNTGFIYGMSTSFGLELPESNIILTEQELAKLNLLKALSYVHFKEFPQADAEIFIAHCVRFYRQFEVEKSALRHLFSLPKSPSEQLEAIINDRVSTKMWNNDISNLLTDIQNFMDVLAYQQYIREPKNIRSYVHELKLEFFHTCVNALNVKTDKNKSDLRFLELLENSKSYELEEDERSGTHFKFEHLYEKLYYLDLSLVSLWSDFLLEDKEVEFLYDFAEEINLESHFIQRASDAIKGFAIANEKQIKLLEYADPIKRIYGQSSHTVKNLISRNKDRLIIELNESGELLQLLGQSTYRDLDKTEKKKVKEQLLDICKTVPSLTIFLLPGGSLLLPLLIKFIPQLLPSAFVDNKIEINKNP